MEETTQETEETTHTIDDIYEQLETIIDLLQR